MKSCDHSRQCVGRKSIRRLVSALTHPPRTLRQGKPTARAPFVSMTASSKSRLNGAVDISCHMKSHQKIGSPLKAPAETLSCHFRPRI